MCYDIEVMIMAKIIGIQTYYRKRFFFKKNTSDFLDHSFWFVHSEHFLVQKWDIKVNLQKLSEIVCKGKSTYRLIKFPHGKYTIF